MLMQSFAKPPPTLTELVELAEGLLPRIDSLFMTFSPLSLEEAVRLIEKGESTYEKLESLVKDSEDRRLRELLDSLRNSVIMARRELGLSRKRSLRGVER